MSWQDPIVSGFAGLNSFFGQITPFLLPMLLVLFVGVTLVFLGKRVVGAVSA